MKLDNLVKALEDQRINKIQKNLVEDYVELREDGVTMTFKFKNNTLVDLTIKSENEVDEELIRTQKLDLFTYRKSGEFGFDLSSFRHDNLDELKASVLNTITHFKQFLEDIESRKTSFVYSLNPALDTKNFGSYKKVNKETYRSFTNYYPENFTEFKIIREDEGNQPRFWALAIKDSDLSMVSVNSTQSSSDILKASHKKLAS